MFLMLLEPCPQINVVINRIGLSIMTGLDCTDFREGEKKVEKRDNLATFFHCVSSSLQRRLYFPGYGVPFTLKRDSPQLHPSHFFLYIFKEIEYSF